MPLLDLVQVAKSETVSESERMIPLSYDVDVIVVGGTLREPAAAEAAKHTRLGIQRVRAWSSC